MANSTLITDYLGRGTHAARPATPLIPAGGTAVYYETDTGVTFVWSGSVWVSVTTSAGTPPAIVQSAITNTVGTSITLATAPVQGNLLVCIAQTGSIAAGAGWTLQSSNGAGTFFGIVATKVAGAGESATQTPIGAAGTGTVIAMWELSGQAASPILNALADEKAAGTFGSSNVLPTAANTICLFGVALEGSGVSFSGVQNMTVDQSALATTGSLRAGKMGHATATAAVYGVLYQMSASTTSRPSYCLVTA